MSWHLLTNDIQHMQAAIYHEMDSLEILINIHMEHLTEQGHVQSLTNQRWLDDNEGMPHNYKNSTFVPEKKKKYLLVVHWVQCNMVEIPPLCPVRVSPTYFICHVSDGYWCNCGPRPLSTSYLPNRRKKPPAVSQDYTLMRLYKCNKYVICNNSYYNNNPL